jgi:hypothetical protein
MSLKKDFVRDGKRRIIASITSGFSDTSAVVRCERNQIAGRTNSPDPGLLIGRGKQR